MVPPHFNLQENQSMLKRFIRYAFLLCCLYPVGLKAQYPNLVFNKLTIQEGLPEESIYCLLQDKQGYIWMGTQAGIVRYDGYKTRVYNFGFESSSLAWTAILFEDNSGRIWAGTRSGLFYYDRATDNFKPFEPAKGNKFSMEFIYDIFKVGEQDLWVISDEGANNVNYIDRVNLASGEISHYSSLEKGSHYINATVFIDMIATKDGKLWVGSNNGIYEYDRVKDKFTGHLTSDDPAKKRGYFSLLEDPLQPGVLWMCRKGGTTFIFDFSKCYGNEGVIQYNSKTDIATAFTHTKNSSSIGNDTLLSIKKDRKNNIWFASPVGLSVYDPVKKAFVNYNIQSQFYSGRYLVDFQPDDKGNVWYAGGKGLQYFDAGTKSFTDLGKRNNFPSVLNSNGRASKILIDRNNTVWVGTYFGGLYWINKKASQFNLLKKDIASPAGYAGGVTWAFSDNKDGSCWIANTNGFYHWFPKNDSFALLPIDPSTDKIEGRSILLDSKGRLWCGSARNGLYQYYPASKKTVHYVFDGKDSSSLSHNNVQKIFEDSRGRIWIGTNGGGLCLWRPETNDFKRYPYISNDGITIPNNGALDDDQTTLIYEDKKGTIWVGTNNGGLNSLDEITGRFTSYRNQPAGFHSVLSAVSTDSGKYYIGTFMDGLFLFDTKTKKAKKITEKDGLLYKGAWQLFEDNDHNVWVASRRGFSIIDAKTKQFRNISRLNGLPETDIFYNGIKNREGKFMIGCDNGILVFDPADFKPDSIAPLLHIEQLSFSNPQDKKKSIDSVVILYGKKEVHLSYDENKLSFYYTALSYQDAAFNQYSVWLDGYEKNWVDMGTQRVATYNNLAPGTYTFHVKASNSDGVWTTTDETITIIISPPWWRTGWAYLLYFVAFVLAIWAYNRYRMAGIKKEKEVLENKVTDRTTRLKQSNEELKSIQAHLEMQSLRAQLNPHFMFNSLNAIQELILMEENDKSHSYLARFSKLLRLLLENTEKPFIPLQREIDFIQLYLSLENLRIPELQFSITVDPAIDTEQTSIPNMILQPYIENAIWHGLSHKPTDKKLQIRITKTNGAIQYEIEDNGVGRKKSAELKSLFRKEHKSKGMELLSKRFKLLSKELGVDIVTSYEDVINNGEVAGTLVIIKVPNNFSEEIKKPIA